MDRKCLSETYRTLCQNKVVNLCIFWILLQELKMVVHCMLNVKNMTAVITGQKELYQNNSENI